MFIKVWDKQGLIVYSDLTVIYQEIKKKSDKMTFLDFLQIITII